MFSLLSWIQRKDPSRTNKQISDLQSQITALHDKFQEFESNQQEIAIHQDPQENVQYPAAEMLAQACYEDYKSTLESYNKLYDKVNVALAFCGVIILKIIERVDCSVITELFQKPSITETVFSISKILITIGSALMIIIAAVELIKLLSSKSVTVFDSVDYYNNRRYLLKPNQLALSLVYAYTGSTHQLRKVTKERQEKYDFAIEEMVVAVIMYVISEII